MPRTLIFLTVRNPLENLLILRPNRSLGLARSLQVRPPRPSAVPGHAQEARGFDAERFGVRENEYVDAALRQLQATPAKRPGS
jgi:hypothetical protein